VRERSPGVSGPIFALLSNNDSARPSASVRPIRPHPRLEDAASEIPLMAVTPIVRGSSEAPELTRVGLSCSDPQKIPGFAGKRADGVGSSLLELVRKEGLEPSRCYPQVPETCASTSSATFAGTGIVAGSAC
jgi:hypothetical protein